MHPHFINQSLTEEISFIFGEVHVVLSVTRIIHDKQRMKNEVRQRVRIRIYPPHGTGSLQTETCLVRKTHREIIGITSLGQFLEITDRTLEVMRADEGAEGASWQITVVTGVDS